MKIVNINNMKNAVFKLKTNTNVGDKYGISVKMKDFPCTNSNTIFSLSFCSAI
jgi:hypothetical protein